MPCIDNNLGHTPFGLTQIGNIIAKKGFLLTVHIFYRLL